MRRTWRGKAKKGMTSCQALRQALPIASYLRPHGPASKADNVRLLKFFEHELTDAERKEYHSWDVKAAKDTKEHRIEIHRAVVAGTTEFLVTNSDGTYSLGSKAYLEADHGHLEFV